MRTLLLDAVDFSLHERLVLSSLLRLLAHQLKHPWDLSEGKAYADVTFTCATLDQAMPRQVSHARASVVRVDSPFIKSLTANEGLFLTLPLRAGRLLECLDRVGSEVQTRMSLAETLLHWSAPVRAIPVLQSLASIHYGAGLQLEVRSGAALDLHLNGAEAMWEGLEGNSFQNVQQAIDAAEPLRLRTTSALAPTRRTTRGPMSALLWLLMMSTPAAALDPTLDPRAWFSLCSWPDFGLLRADPALIHLSALMMRAPLRLDDLLAASQAERGRTLAYLNACSSIGLLRQTAAGEPSSARRVAPSRAGIATPRAAPGSRRLFERLRFAFGLAS